MTYMPSLEVADELGFSIQELQMIYETMQKEYLEYLKFAIFFS